MPKVANPFDYIGKKFNRLTVIEYLYLKNKHRFFNFKCDCGNHKILPLNAVKTGCTQSCGCYAKETHKKGRGYKHGQIYHPLQGVWCSMKARCHNPKCKKFKNYGERGITICSEWRNDYMAFFNWAIDKWKKGLTIERIDNDGNYCPDNCCFITNKMQSRNKTTNRMITFNGQTKSVIQWSEDLGIKYKLLSWRINNGWSAERAITQPKA